MIHVIGLSPVLNLTSDKEVVEAAAAEELLPLLVSLSPVTAVSAGVLAS